MRIPAAAFLCVALAACSTKQRSARVEAEPASSPAATLPTQGAAVVPADGNPTASSDAAPAQQGEAIYKSTCATCHMADGSGVPNLQPSLVDSAVVRGDPARLLRVILHGPAAVLPANRPKYANIMPPNAALLDDRQAADVATYVRAAFAGETGGPVQPPQVRALRTP